MLHLCAGIAVVVVLLVGGAAAADATTAAARPDMTHDMTHD